MSLMGYKRITIVLGLVCLGLLVLTTALFLGYAPLHLRLAFASEQTQIFEEMRTKALKSGVAEAAGCLEYVTAYYPSGTKQVTGSRLDRIVERERAAAVRDIIAYLRKQTTSDLGDAPEPWVEKYAHR
jgi:hypothetical protein